MSGSLREEEVVHRHARQESLVEPFALDRPAAREPVCEALLLTAQTR